MKRAMLIVVLAEAGRRAWNQWVLARDRAELLEAATVPPARDVELRGIDVDGFRERAAEASLRPLPTPSGGSPYPITAALDATCDYCGARDPRWIRWIDQSFRDYFHRTTYGFPGPTARKVVYCDMPACVDRANHEIRGIEADGLASLG